MPPESLPASRVVNRARSVKASSRLKVVYALRADHAAQVGVQIKVLLDRSGPRRGRTSGACSR